MRALPAWALRECLELAEAAGQQGPLKQQLHVAKLIAEIDRCLTPSKSSKSHRAAKAKKKAARKEIVSDVRPQVEARANGVCECGCCLPMHEGFLAVPEWDEFWGRANVKPTTENTWMLRRDHHDAKSNERPSRRAWLELFRAHCIRHEYWEQARECGWALARLETKEKLKAGVA